MDFKSMLQSMTSLSEAEGSRVHKGTYGTSYGKEDVRDQYGHKVGKVDKGAEAKKDAPKKGRGRPKKDGGEESKFDTSALSGVFGGKKPSGKVGTVSKKHSLKEYMESIEAEKSQLDEGEQIEIKPASATQTQVIQQGDKTLGTVSNPQLANQIKQSIGKGEMTLAGDEELAEVDMGQYDAVKAPLKGGDNADWDKNFREKLKQYVKELEQRQAEKQGQVAEDKKPDFTDVDDDKNETESWTKAEQDKMKQDKMKVAESRDFAASEYTDEQIGKILSREKPGLDTNSDDFYSAVYHELIQMGLTPKAARYKLNIDEDFMGDVASAYSHFQENPTLDEGSMDDFRQHALAEPTNNFKTQGQVPGSMAAPRGAKTEINRPVPEPTPWGTDPIAAATDRAFNFVSSLGKGTKFTKEGTEMKDIQLESWEQQLNGLLTEGITVSSSQGQQGSPDTVSVTASDSDAEALLSVLRNAGIGGFGAEPQAPEIGYGVAQGGEDEPTGTGTEPQAAPEVVGDDGDMLSMLKKMAGLSGEGDAEVVAISGDEGGQDYKDEEGQETGGEEQDQTLEPASSDEEGSEEKEETDEGNAFGQEVRQKKADNIPDSQQRITTGGQNLPVKEEGEDTCNECGMVESSCGCDHEQVEENFANSATDPAETELAQLKALLSMGNDMHRVKQSQAMGNPVRVAESDALSQWKKLSGI